MKKVVFLSMDSLEKFECYDHLVREPLLKLGWQVQEVSWRRKEADWNYYDAVVVRSTWDYQSDPERFLLVLEEIENSKAHLENNLSILKWNMNKKYLADLREKGVKIVETLWEKSFDKQRASGYFNLLKCDEIIIKPTISANADNTYRCKNAEEYPETITIAFLNREFMVQPFIKSIVDEGEYSLFFFSGEYSHAILKKPKNNDFRVQEEHGGILRTITPDKELIRVSEDILSKLETTPLYARVDLVRIPSNEFALMELELIEPSLYFNMDNKAPERFASAFHKRMK